VFILELARIAPKPSFALPGKLWYFPKETTRLHRIFRKGDSNWQIKVNDFKLEFLPSNHPVGIFVGTKKFQKYFP
jgi:hypothetical protein